VNAEVLDDAAAAAAERIAAACRSGANVVLTGGSTARAAYERLAAMGLDLGGVRFWFTDERCVPPEDERSNFGMAREAFLERASGVDAVHRIECELGPEPAAARYADELRAGFPDAGAWPRMDLVLLGLGPDAHVCSLFPGDAALRERERWVAGVERPGMEPLVPRVTLTLPLVNAAGELVFLVTGADKADAVARAFGGGPDPDVPGSLVRPADGSLTVLLDRAAATLL
jgi:6-phosphogluconolactonase